VAKRAIFPVSFLILIVPLPPVILDRIILALQVGSADISFVLFKILRVPVFRDGLKFALPGVDIEVATQCSGIRSSMSLFIASILVAQALLRSGWRRVCLCLLTIPVVIFKNAVRIVTISWLGVYADQRFFFGKLHHAGGLPFSLVALAILGALLFALRKSEARSPKRVSAAT
jgi:exosortase